MNKKKRKFGNYLKKVLEEELPQREGGGFFVTIIKHDDWCKSFKTKNVNDCNCNPELETKEVKP